MYEWLMAVVDFLLNQWLLGIAVIFVLLGGLLVLIALFVLRTVYYSGERSYLTSGRVLGALERCGQKRRKDGSLRTRDEHYLVVEYSSPDGALLYGTLSEWSSTFMGYREGDVLELRVMPTQAYDDIYLADRSATLKLGMVLLLIGLGITLAATRSPVWWGILLILSVFFVLLLPRFLQGVDTGKQPLPWHKGFTKGDIVALESLKG